MRLAQDVMSVAELEDDAASLVTRVSEERRALLITDGGHAKAVLMDVTSYDQWRETTALLKLVAQSEGALAAGQIVSQEDAFARAEKAIDEVAGAS